MTCGADDLTTLTNEELWGAINHNAADGANIGHDKAAYRERFHALRDELLRRTGAGDRARDRDEHDHRIAYRVGRLANMILQDSSEHGMYPLNDRDPYVVTAGCIQAAATIVAAEQMGTANIEGSLDLIAHRLNDIIETMGARQ